MNRAWGINSALLLIAVIWGFGFVPQKIGLEHFDPAAFNAWRFALGALCVLLAAPLLRTRRPMNAHRDQANNSIALGFVLGAMLFVGALMQQVSLLYTSVANVSFITGLYVIIVPIIGILLGYRYRLVVWGGGLIAIAGLYLLTQGGGETTLKGDLIALIGAVFWALHILLLAQYAGRHDQLRLSIYQFAFCALLSLIYALCFETRLIPVELGGFLWPILNGVVVVGIAYTLQVLVMPKAEPFAASLILSLEAVFGALAAYLIFDESLVAAAMVGALLMLIGCGMAQSDEGRKPDSD